ncbi:endopeptidase La [Christensenellaceae bacterium OttesenSCG-928-L17]|nr:endopeptidase La [Christensenellaceae bacterium OttesenSCG-928-L17]
MLKTLPVIPLRGMAVMPGEVAHCDAGRKKTLAALSAAASGDGLAFVCAQKDAQQDSPGHNDFHKTGTICRVKQVFRIQGEGVHMLLTGVSRAYARHFTAEEPYFEASVFEVDQVPGDPATLEALRRRIQDVFLQCVRLSGKVNNNQRAGVEALEDPVAYADMVTALFISDVGKRQALLEELNEETYMEHVLELIGYEAQILKIDEEIKTRLSGEIEKNQKEYYLREKIKVIRKELGDESEQEAEELRTRAAAKNLPEDVYARVTKEIDRFEALPAGSHEAPGMRAFIECVLDLPWNEQTEDNLNIDLARQVLAENHYGMEKVKDRILEYLAVQQLTGKPGGEILCLVGPPGVGKTSIVASIAEAMGRKFVRMSLGGVRDEAEIRGHRRTYIGAMPGRIIAAMRQAGANNPVLLFDEIDKLASDFRGDPAAAMLEVLDSAQNFAFKDHFLEIPYDLSKAMLLTTANDTATIPRALLDRMEVIEVPSYLAEEKLEIAKRHLLPKQLKAHGLKKSNLRMTDAQIAAVIQGYTREAGVRELERMLGAVCRKAAVDVVAGKKSITVNAGKLKEYLGHPIYRAEAARTSPEIGVVTGLAWTPVGGETLSVEATVLPGTGNVQLTGQLGEVMQESAKAALTYVRAHAADWNIPLEAFKENDVHVHVPQGAVKKDGPSAGVAIAVAILSAFSKMPVRADIAMTGEITLRGHVLPIGGVREKTLAAFRNGITNVLLPKENEKDTEEIPEPARSAFSFQYVETLDELFQTALLPAEKKPHAGQPPYMNMPVRPANGYQA